MNMHDEKHATSSTMDPLLMSLLPSVPDMSATMESASFARMFKAYRSHWPRDAPSANTSGISATSFTGFSDLPIEIRQKIWKDAAHHPRLLELQYSDFNAIHGLSYRRRRRTLTLVTRSRRSPGMLHACQEARKVGLKHYKLTNFGNIYEPFSITNIAAMRLKAYFHNSVDTVVFGDQVCVCITGGVLQTTPEIQKIAIHICESEATWCPLGNDAPPARIEKVADKMIKLMSIIHGVEIDGLPGPQKDYFPGIPNICEVAMMPNTPCEDEFEADDFTWATKRRCKREIIDLEPVENLRKLLFQRKECDIVDRWVVKRIHKGEGFGTRIRKSKWPGKGMPVLRYVQPQWHPVLKPEAFFFTVKGKEEYVLLEDAVAWQHDLYSTIAVWPESFIGDGLYMVKIFGTLEFADEVEVDIKKRLLRHSIKTGRMMEMCGRKDPRYDALIKYLKAYRKARHTADKEIGDSKSVMKSLQVRANST